MADIIYPSPGQAPQMPQAANSGSAPVPYQGPDLSPEPPMYHAEMGPMADPVATVLAGVTGLGTTEDPSAHDIAAGTADAPYYPGAIDPINPAGGIGDVAGDVAGSMANAQSRWHELSAQALPAGSVIGSLMELPPSPLDPGVGSLGTTDPAGGFYDPPRDYSTDPNA
jgi:hypothetical protein